MVSGARCGELAPPQLVVKENASKAGDEAIRLASDIAWETEAEAEQETSRICRSQLRRASSSRQKPEDGKKRTELRSFWQCVSEGSSAEDLQQFVQDLGNESDSSFESDIVKNLKAAEKARAEIVPDNSGHHKRHHSGLESLFDLASDSSSESEDFCDHLSCSSSTNSSTSAETTACLPESELVRPAHWTDRQMEVAALGPLQCRDMKFSEFLWWLKARATSMAGLMVSHTAQYLIAVVLALPWAFWDGRFVAHVYCMYAVLYTVILFSNAGRNGRRSSPGFQKWFAGAMEMASVMHLNGGMTIIKDSTDTLLPAKKYIFTYHPHGLLPAVLTWFSRCAAWKKLFPSINPIGLVATAIFRVPFLRDFGLLGGLREVSRGTFLRALDEAGSVIVCPGGQSELALHLRASKKRVVLAGRKAGFIRVALETEALLVPIALFGEAQLMDNLFDFPAAQRATYKYLGFPVPFLPVGLGGCLPLPRKGNVTMVVGKPFDPKEYCSSRDPSAEQLEAVRSAYYDRVLSLYTSYQKQLGYADWSFSIDHKR